ncbi:hypothetical protein BDW42DRAFT_162170 [Aspergillus taichungensis]|uniref:Uncharacterized protein n=1 Tax=Aspergillus taichungensis TaxID=482145 RepID=A0A2J5I4F9_9EURO|nr:hypothetical protein BDW42DRAFT_162170 [Aspergillus taichungensis]
MILPGLVLITPFTPAMRNAQKHSFAGNSVTNFCTILPITLAVEDPSLCESHLLGLCIFLGRGVIRAEPGPSVVIRPNNFPVPRYIAHRA